MSVLVPIFEKVTNCAELGVHTADFESKEVGEKLTLGTAAMTVSVAALLVTLPAGYSPSR